MALAAAFSACTAGAGEGETKVAWGPLPAGWQAFDSDRRDARTLPSQSEAPLAVGGQQLKFYAGNWGKNDGGVSVDVALLDRPWRTFDDFKSALTANMKGQVDYEFSETTFQGYRTFRIVGKEGAAMFINKIGLNSHQESLFVEVDPENHKWAVIGWDINIGLSGRTSAEVEAVKARAPGILARYRQEVAQFLETLRLTGPVGPPPPPRRYSATIALPPNPKPGDVISPSATYEDQDGKPPKQIKGEAWLFNGKWGHSVVWDGKPLVIELQASIEGQALVKKVVVPAYQTSSAPPKEPPTTSTTSPASAAEGKPFGEIIQAPTPGLTGIGPLPGPKNPLEAIISVVGPGLIGLIGSILSGLLGGGKPVAPAPSVPPPPSAPKPLPRSPRAPRMPEPAPQAAQPEKPEPPPKEPRKTRSRAEQKERAERAQREAEKATREAAAAGSIAGTLSNTLSNIGKEVRDTGQATKELVTNVGQAVHEAARDVYRDPTILTNTLKGSLDTVKEGVKAVGNSAVETGKDLVQAGKDVYKNPEILVDTLKGSWTTTKEGIGAIAKGVWDFLTDPRKVWEAIKSFSGLQNFENAMDPNRSLPDRILQVGVGVANLYGTITLTQAVGKKLVGGGTGVIGKTGVIDDVVGAGGRGAGKSPGAGRAMAGTRKPPAPGSKVSPTPRAPAAPEVPTASRPAAAPEAPSAPKPGPKPAPEPPPPAKPAPPKAPEPAPAAAEPPPPVPHNTRNLDQVRQHLAANPSDAADYYINMDKGRLTQTMRSQTLVPGSSGAIYASPSGSGPLGYTFPETHVVRIPKGQCIEAARFHNGRFLDSAGKVISVPPDKVVMVAAPEGTGRVVMYVDQAGNPTLNLPASKLQRWVPGHGFAPV